MYDGNSLFTLVSTVVITACAAAMIAVMGYILSASRGGRARAALAMGAWFLIVVVVGAKGGLAPQSGAGVIGLGIATLTPLAVLCFVLTRHGPARAPLFRIPLALPIAVNVLRTLGVLFLFLYAKGELPAPFAPSAGWGDVFVGLTAAPVAWAASRYGSRATAWIVAWNLIGFLDLVAAIGLGATSSPGPVRIFLNAPDSSIMTMLPWIIIPCFLVPIFEALHVALFFRLFQDRAAPRAAPSSGAFVKQN
jgi:hypothetical protein